MRRIYAFLALLMLGLNLAACARTCPFGPEGADCRRDMRNLHDQMDSDQQ